MVTDFSEGFRKGKRKNMLITTVLCIICIGINFLLFGIVNGLGLPLYLDSVGILLASVLGGYIPGIFVGFATNIINCFFRPVLDILRDTQRAECSHSRVFCA